MRESRNILVVLGLLAICGASRAVGAVNIVGGSNATSANNFTHYTVAVEIVIRVEGVASQNTCTGTIIDSSRVVTAAHCVGNFESGRIVFQLANVDNTWFGPTVRAITGLPKVEPGYLGDNSLYNPLQDDNDVSVVTFSGGLPAGFSPANFLASKDELLQKAVVGSAVMIVGYGTTFDPFNSDTPPDGNTLRFTTGPLTDYTDGQGNFTVRNEGHSACEGDSGGPAIITLDGVEYVIGVLSRAVCGSSSRYSAVYSSAL